jgi:hypothetical protein
MQRLVVIAVIAALLLMTLRFKVDAQINAEAFPEYRQYVHTD